MFFRITLRTRVDSSEQEVEAAAAWGGGPVTRCPWTWSGSRDAHVPQRFVGALYTSAYFSRNAML